METAKKASIVVLPKVKDACASSLYRPISLTNSDYKILMKVWAGRLGPILNCVVGPHQLGFIPGRDGRENVLNIQMLVDHYNGKGANSKGALLFLDFKKAFDLVSHEALIAILQHFRWPPTFVKAVAGIYKANTATVLVNGTASAEFLVQSGTRQGCPISPLLFTIIAEVLCQNLINNEEFKGLKVDTYKKKVGAYADDTVIGVSSVEDIQRFNRTFKDFEKATGMALNPSKSEAVLLGKWKEDPPPGIPFPVKKWVKYLGCPVGHLTGRDYSKIYKDMEDKIHSTFIKWKGAASSQWDRTVIAKTMVLSKLWYMASVIPWDMGSLRRIQKHTLNYLWSYGSSKVGKAQLMRPKKKGGLGIWQLPSKVRALNASWGFALHDGSMGTELSRLIKVMTGRDYLGLDPLIVTPLLTSGTSCQEYLVAETHSFTLGYLLENWGRVSVRLPEFKVGDLVYYAEGGGTLDNGIGKVRGSAGDGTTTVKWITFPREEGVKGVEWSIATKALYLADAGVIPDAIGGYSDCTSMGLETPKEVLSLKVAKDPVSVKVTKHGPAFNRVEVNKHLYQAQLCSALKMDAGGVRKTLRWEVLYGKSKVRKAFQANWSSSLSSKIQSFRWLLLNHALPVGTRLGLDKPCPMCGEEESIEHLFFDCTYASTIWREVIAGWMARAKITVHGSNSDLAIIGPGWGFWNTVCFPRPNADLPKVWTVIQGVTAYHIWRSRCTKVFRGKVPPPPEVEVPQIWQHVSLTIAAEIDALEDTKIWWLARMGRMNTHQAAKVRKDVIPFIEEDVTTLKTFQDLLPHKSQVRNNVWREGATGTALPYRNRFSAPFWYEAITNPSSLQDVVTVPNNMA